MKAILAAVLIWSLTFTGPMQLEDLVPGYWERTALPEIGLATYYAPGMMEKVWDYRRQHGQVPECPECVGTVALLRAGDIGRKVWLQPPHGELAGPFLVIDCARREDVWPLVQRTWVVDISYELGQLWGMDRPLDNVVVWPDPAEEEAWAAGSVVAGPYIDPAEIVITAPTTTPQPVPDNQTGWPTRLPAQLAQAPVLLTPTPPPGLAAPVLGTPIIATPTPPVSAASGSDILPTPTIETWMEFVPSAVASGATPIAAESLGRPGSELLLTSQPVAPRPTIDPATIAALSTSYGTPRPTSPPILPTPEVPFAPPATQEEVSAFVRLWQAVRDWVAP